MFDAIKEKDEKLYEKVVLQIKEKIASGELKFGDKLPSERELTEILNVSRSSIREAMKTLEVLGIVSVKHGQGIFISDKSQEKMIELLKPFLFLNNDSIRNLFDVRKSLETQAVAWAAERAKKEELITLKDELDNIQQKKYKNEISAEDIREHNNRFHYLISTMSHNPVLIRMMSVMDEFINDIYEKTIVIPERINKSISEHYEIYNSIKEGDSEKARKLMMNHLSVVEYEIEQYLIDTK